MKTLRTAAELAAFNDQLVAEQINAEAAATEGQPRPPAPAPEPEPEPERDPRWSECVTPRAVVTDPDELAALKARMALIHRRQFLNPVERGIDTLQHARAQLRAWAATRNSRSATR